MSNGFTFTGKLSVARLAGRHAKGSYPINAYEKLSSSGLREYVRMCKRCMSGLCK